MPSESVDILIRAEDRATPKFQAAQASLNDISQRVKEVGGRTKATTELIGTFANALGGTAFGQFAGQIAQLTERVSAFSEVSKAGAAGALALRAGIYAAAAIATYKITESIAGWYFEAAKWRREMEAADKAAQKASQALQAVRQKQFSQQREDIDLIRDPVQREQAGMARAAQLDKDASNLESKIAAQRQKLLQAQKEYDTNFSPFGGDDRKASVDAQQQLLDDLTEMQSAYREEADTLRDSFGERAKRIAQLKQENSAADRSDEFIKNLREEIEWLKATEAERQKLSAQRGAVQGDQGLAQQLIAERDKLRQAEKDREKAAADATRLAEIEKGELERLEEKNILLRDGAEAANVFRLKQKGLTEESAKEIAAREAILDEQLAEKNKPKDEKKAEVKSEPIAATQGRLLTRGSGDPAARLVQFAEKQAQLQADAVKILGEILNATGNNVFSLEVAGSV